MNSKILVPVALVAFAGSTAFAADSNFERTLNTGASPNVTVSTGSGYIHLHPGSDNQVHIAGHVHANQGWFGGDSDSRLQEIVNNPPIVQNGDEIVIGQRRSGDMYRNISIDYDIALPRASSINATTGSGDLEIHDVGATIKAQSGSGNVKAQGIKGPATLGTGSGDIELQQAGPGDVKAETGSGNIRLHGVSSALKAGTGSGDVEVDGQVATDWKLSTGSGNITLNVGGSHFNLDADTGSGNINVAQPITMQGSLNHHHVSGSVNGGGPTLRASTGSGDIKIR